VLGNYDVRHGNAKGKDLGAGMARTVLFTRLDLNPAWMADNLGPLVCLSVALEDTGGIIDDLEQGLAC